MIIMIKSVYAVLRHSRTVRKNGALISSITTTSLLRSEMKEWECQLLEAGVEDVKESVNYIVAHALGRKTIATDADISELNLTTQQRNAVLNMIEQRRNRVPVQYIIGEWDFMDLTLKMRPPVHLPRPESECFVEHIIDNEEKEPDNFLEIGCGSGALSLALLNNYKKSRAIAIDCDPAACALTDENAKMLGFDDRIQVKHIQLDEDTLNRDPVFLNDKYDMILCNPPYIESSVISSLQREVKDYESRVSLDGGMDGMDVTRLVLQLASKALNPHKSLWLKCSPSQPERVRQMSRKYDTLNYVETLTDFRRIPRICWLKNESTGRERPEELIPD